MEKLGGIIVRPAEEKLIPSFYACLKAVASERVYLEMVEPPPLEKVTEFQLGLIRREGPVFYAVQGEKVLGWCDVFPEENLRQSHRGSLGMGMYADVRGRGVGSRLLAATLEQAARFGLEKVELNVYTDNGSAISLYRKFGFVQEGLIRKYRKLDGQYFDCIAMAKFLA